MASTRAWQCLNKIKTKAKKQTKKQKHKMMDVILVCHLINAMTFLHMSLSLKQQVTKTKPLAFLSPFSDDFLYFSGCFRLTDSFFI